MSEVILYQAVLQKLGQLSPQNLAELDAFLAFLVQKQKGNLRTNEVKPELSPDQFFGIWKDWDDQEFQRFLDHTEEVRADLFGAREVEL